MLQVIRFSNSDIRGQQDYIDSYRLSEGERSLMQLDFHARMGYIKRCRVCMETCDQDLLEFEQVGKTGRRRIIFTGRDGGTIAELKGSRLALARIWHEGSDSRAMP